MITVSSPVGVEPGRGAEARRPRRVAERQQLLFERTRNRVGRLKLRAMYKKENWPDRKRSAFVPTFGTSKSVTRKIE